MDTLPLWNVLLLTVVAVLVAIELGYRTGNWRAQARNKTAVSEAQLSAMTGAHLALLAFIMAFSFNMAAGHYQDRRQLVVDEANAISTAYLRADLIDAPQARAIQKLLAEYSQLRGRAPTIETIGDAMEKSADIQTAMWQQIEALTRESEPNVLNNLLIQSINDVLDIHERRVAAGLRNRVPPSLWATLFALLALSMAGLGYFSGIKGSRSPVASTGLALSFSLVLFLIADLDRPASGLVKADQSAMSDLQRRLNL